MKIGLDALILRARPAGVAGSVWKLLRALHALEAAEPAHEYVVYVGREFSKEYPATELAGARWRLAPTCFPARWRLWRALWEQLWLPTRTLRDQLDLLHGPAYILPRSPVTPTVATVHDAIVLERPELCWRGSLRYLRRAVPRTCATATRIIAPTEAARRALIAHAGAELERVRVVPFGVEHERFRPLPEQAELAAARARLKLPERFLLFVGQREPKKNLPQLVRAFFAAVVARKLPHALVLVGGPGWGGVDDELARTVAEHKLQGRVFQTGYLEDAALPLLYNLAEAFVLPSLIEGFGLPVLEAQACGTPVLASRDPALVEVAGGAALHVDVSDLRDFRLGIEELLLNERRRQDLRERGLVRAKEFTWERTARETRAVYEEAKRVWDEAAGSDPAQR